MSISREAAKKRSAEKKLEKLRKKAHAKVLKYQKRMEKIRRHAEKKAFKYATIEKHLIDLAKPQVGDPVLPKTATLPPERPKTESVEAQAAEISRRRAKKEQEARERAEKKRIQSGNYTMFERFEGVSFEELEGSLMKAQTRDERIFYRTVLNLKLQIEQEKVIGEELL